MSKSVENQISGNRATLASTIPHTYKHDSESVVKLSENSTLDKTF